MSLWVISLSFIRSLLLSFLVFTVFPIWSAEVVFIELHQDGRSVELEPGGRFFHVAIRYKGLWLHAHPQGGVSLVEDIRPYGDRFVVLKSPADPEPSEAYVQAWLGKSFDYNYHWFNETANYCSRLVGVALGIPPQPMSFAANFWKNQFTQRDGEPGLSPDKLFAELTKRGYKTDCQGDL